MVKLDCSSSMGSEGGSSTFLLRFAGREGDDSSAIDEELGLLSRTRRDRWVRLDEGGMLVIALSSGKTHDRQIRLDRLIEVVMTLGDVIAKRDAVARKG